MLSTVVYALGGTSLVLAVIVTILDAICYVWSHYSSLEVAILGLSAVSCIGLVLLLVLRQRHSKPAMWSRRNWPSIVHSLLIAYLFIAAGTTAGLIARSSITVPAQPPLITRNIFWALSVFVQALFSGFHLFANTQQRNGAQRWPHPLAHELEALENYSSEGSPEQGRPHSSSTIAETYRPAVAPKGSPDASTPTFASSAATRVSSRYSGNTLFQQDSKRNSIDLHSGVTCSNTADEGRETGSVVDQGQQATITIDTPAQESDISEEKRSTDSLLVLPSPPSPTESSTTLGSSTIRPILPTPSISQNERNEKNIHPLFRSGSPSPPPTPMPGTMVKASPVAGTTISASTLSRVRSSNSLRIINSGRSRSPLEQMSEEDNPSQCGSPCAVSPIPGIIMAGDVRRSMMRYGKKYNLNESTHEG